VKPQDPYARSTGDDYDRKRAAFADFQNILLNDKSDALIFRMLSRFAACYIEWRQHERALTTTEDAERGKLIDAAFERFDPLANCLNHIFEQFAVNQVVTRSGFVPRQEGKITAEVYVPTLRVLSDPKWKGVSDDLGKCFRITKSGITPKRLPRRMPLCTGFYKFLPVRKVRAAKVRSQSCFRRRRTEG